MEMPIGIGLLLGGVFLLFMVLSVVALVCTIIVMVKMFQNDMAPLAVIGFFVPLILYVFGWIKAQEWGLTKTMVAWTVSMILTPVLVIGGIIGAASVGWMSMPADWDDMSPTSMDHVGPPVPGGPGPLNSVRGQVGKVSYLDIRGTRLGTIYGSDIYTDDSDLATAAVHAGVLKDGEEGTVKVTILPGQQSYPSVTRNGVTSNPWNAWGGSFKVERNDGGGEAEKVSGQRVLPDPGTLTTYQGKNGQVFYFTVKGAVIGTVYGTDVYTDDSQLATAAVHAGILKNGETGKVKVTIWPGQASYNGSTRNNINSSSYGRWSGSYRVERAD